MQNKLNTFIQTISGATGASSLLDIINNNSETKELLRELAKYYLNEKLTGCSNCYVDAAIRLRSLSKNTIMEKSNKNFVLRAGALLTDTIRKDMRLVCTNANASDELVMYHISTNPAYTLARIESMPENVQEMLKNFDPVTYRKKVTDVDMEFQVDEIDVSAFDFTGSTVEVVEKSDETVEKPVSLSKTKRKKLLKEFKDAIDSGADEDFLKETFVDTELHGVEISEELFKELYDELNK